MKKSYIYPEAKLYRFTIDNVLQHFAAGSDIAQPTIPGGIPAAQRMAALGNTTVKSNLGSLGSVGSIRSIGTLK